MQDARLLQVNVSRGGVPKRPVEAARITIRGVEGDRQADTTGHGGPHRAVSILGIEAIRRAASEGHPIAPGTTGENLTTEGFDVSLLPAGTRLAIGDEVVLELSMQADPCRTIRHSFLGLRYGRLGRAAHPADSRMYARVVAEGTVRAGDPIRLEPPAGAAADDFLLAHRIERAERSSNLAVWAAARAGGIEIHVVDDGDLAIGAAPAVPAPTFNAGFGFALLPDLVHLAAEHFARHRVSGWVWADDPPWDGAAAETRAVYLAGPVTSSGQDAADDGIGVRELGRDEVGAWADVVITAAEMEPATAAAWHALEPHLALDAHTHRFVAERDGAAVGAGLLHTHHGVGWLRAGTVLPAYRGLGIQRRLLTGRMEHARRLGCDLVGASADEGSVSQANLERVGLRPVARRARYRVVASTA